MIPGGCAFVETRTSPFGKYARCRCGWISPMYSSTHLGAYSGWIGHRDARTGPDVISPQPEVVAKSPETDDGS